MKYAFFLLFLFFQFRSFSQDSTGLALPPEKASKRRWMIGGLTAAGYGGSFAFLSSAWYTEFSKAPFHTFNDAGEWLQVDKVGHAWTTYQTSRLTTAMWHWAGASPGKAIWLGTGSSLLYMLSIEYLDGRSEKWGWSWADVGSNVVGASLFAAQQAGWKEQKISLKFSATPKKYLQRDLAQRADHLYGNSFQGRLLKDYNAQTYWISANLSSIWPNTNLPQWLNLSVGYGGEGMFGGYENRTYNENGTVLFDRRDIKRYRQWYLAPDVDFTKIKTNTKVVRTLFSALNVLKFPAPALEWSGGRFQFKALVY